MRIEICTGQTEGARRSEFDLACRKVEFDCRLVLSVTEQYVQDAKRCMIHRSAGVYPFATTAEAAQILGANQWTIISRVVFPNILVAVLSGAFLTLAIVIGEFTIASLLNRPAFGPYLVGVGTNRAYEPSALAIISLLVTWGAMGMIQVLARFAPKTARKD